ncbi:MAG: DUF2927 domain-containing protein [Rhodobacteraceae bacterium]|nr:DUF2927 domain-containing protein [Paracoccaceae bacterium]
MRIAADCVTALAQATKAATADARLKVVRQSLLALPLAAALAGCAFAPEPRLTPHKPDARPAGAPALTALTAGPVKRDNAAIAQDFDYLVFETEGGRRFDQLNKLREPIAVAFLGQRFNEYRPFTRKFVQELAREADIDLFLAETPEQASQAASRVHIRFVSFGEMDISTPDAQCIFLAGAEPFWRIIDDEARYAELAQQISPSEMTVYIPINATPEEVRECLYEEITQALGPQNDLLHLSDSIFNDENSHSRPTPYDLLILKALYDRRLQPLQSRDEVMALLPAILADHHPSGLTSAAMPPLARWKELDSLWNTALSHRNDAEAIAERFNEASAMANQLPAHDYRRLAFEAVSLALHRPANAPEQFAELAERFEAPPFEDPLRAALMRVEQVVALHASARWSEVPAAANGSLDTLARAGRDDRVAELYCSLSSALYSMGRREEALEHGAQCLTWTSYALGEDHPETMKVRGHFTRLQEGL